MQRFYFRNYRKDGTVSRTSYSIQNKEWGGLEFWFTESLSDLFPEDKYYGGVEHHMKSPPNYMDKDKPSHEYCSVNFGKCWHDGSSLAFDRYKDLIGNDEEIFLQLESEIEDIIHDRESQE